MASTKSPVFFNPNTTYYRSHFALKTIIQLVSEEEEPPGRSFQLDFNPVWSDICQMLRWYGANQVGKLRTAPDTLMEVQFTSDKALKKFLQSKQKIETAMAEIMTKRFCSTKTQDSSATFKVSTVLLLVTPNDATGSTEFRPVTLANHRNCVSLYIRSKIAELPSEPESALKTVPEDVLTENDLPELMKLLSDVVDWHGLGLVLGISPHRLQMIESDLSGTQMGRTLRLLSCVLVEWMKNHEEATWSTLVHALSSVGKKSSARRIAHEYGVHIPDESVLEDLTPEQREKLQEILEKIKQVLNSQPSDMEMEKIQNAIKEAQQKKQLTLETFASIVEDTISKVKVLLAQKGNLEKLINDKERQLQELREGQSVTALSLKQELAELQQQLLETDQQLYAARAQHSSQLFKTSAEICALTNQTQQLMSENATLGADLRSKITLIKSLESSNTSLIQLTANLQLSLDMALQHQQRLSTQILEQEEQHEREVAVLREKVQVQWHQDRQHTSSPEAFKILKEISDIALKQLDCLTEKELQPNPLHPQAKITWKPCRDLPVRMSEAQTVVIRDRVYCSGGFVNDDDVRYQVFCYSPSDDTWKTLPDRDVRRFGLGQVRGKIVTVGGRKKSNEVTNEVCEFDEVTQCWKQSIPPMPTARWSPAVLSHHSTLTVAGGSTGRTHTSIVEIFIEKTSQWHKTEPLPFRWLNPSSLLINNRWYLLGGGAEGKYYSNRAVFAHVDLLLQKILPHNRASGDRDSTSNSAWVILPNTPHYGPAAATFSTSLLAVGGSISHIWSLKPQVVKTVHVYSPCTNAWIHISDLPTPRMLTATAMLSPTELLVIGGWSDGFQSSVCKGLFQIE